MDESSNIQSAGLALGGGAARGWAHIGVILALAEKNIRITHIAGTSIGAFVGAFYATNGLDILLKNVMHLDWRHGVGYFASVPSKTGMINGRKITEFLRKHLNATTLAETSIPLCTVATDLRTGAEVTLSRGSIVDAVRASIAIPGIFTPVQKEDFLLVDGGLVNPVPVSTLRKMGAERTIAVDLNGIPADSDVPLLETERPNMLEIIGVSANIIEAGLTQKRLTEDPPDLLIRPDLAHVSYLDFNKGEELIRLGYEAAIHALMQKKTQLMDTDAG